MGLASNIGNKFDVPVVYGKGHAADMDSLLTQVMILILSFCLLPVTDFCTKSLFDHYIKCSGYLKTTKTTTEICNTQKETYPTTRCIVYSYSISTTE